MNIKLHGAEFFALLAPRAKAKKGEFLRVNRSGLLCFSRKRTEIVAMQNFDNTKGKESKTIKVKFI